MNLWLILLLAQSSEPQKLQVKAHSPGVTDCARCHTVDGWLPAQFDHQRTGFALEGAHQKARCAACHRVRLDASLSRSCIGCHRDAHRGELGQRCEACHGFDTWKSRFSADAHRRTAFPLSGAHALLPCEECHVDAWNAGFTRAGVACARCHLDDYQRTTATNLDHERNGFDQRCQSCHSTWTFARARFPQHEACFQIAGGPHGGIGCQSCHTSIMGAGVTGRCETFTAACTSCHEHSCDRSDREHREVPGYQCKDRKCYECHRFSE